MMLHRKILAACLAVAPFILSAQVSTGGMPYGLRAGLDLGTIPTVHSAAFDMAMVASEDARRAAEGKIPAYSRILAVDAGLHDAGQWTDLANGDRLWRLRIASTGALATELFLSDFHLPDNASLYVYSEDGQVVLGGFTAYNNTDDGSFTTSLIAGDASIMEYYEPAAVAGEGSFRVTGVGHAYRNVGEVTDVGACEVDVNCSEGNEWHPQRDAVVRMSIVQGGFLYWCSGALVNNLDQDCKPYFLSAQHCDEGATQSELNQWKFYFNYEKSGCGSGTSPANHTLTGCYRRGGSNDGGGDSGSDFLLVEGKAPIPSSYNPYWAGWDATGAGSSSGVGIHHPQGDRKKISTYTSSTQSTTVGGVPNTHWRVQWASTTNGQGVTEPGSSGSPLFNTMRRILGTLTGGFSCCTTGDCGPGSSINGADYYGKMSYHWASDPGPANMRLKNWLDPQNTGILIQDGSYDPCSTTAGIGRLGEAGGRLGLYPNPANDAATIALPEGMWRGGVIEVLDMAGRFVGQVNAQTSSETRLQTGVFDSGAYLVRLLVDGQVVASAPLIVVHP